MTVSRPACVLVVDDEPAPREIAERYLAGAGWRVLTAEDGEAGLQLARDADAVVLDVMLPRLDGWRVLEALRRDSRVPVLMLSALGEETERLRGLEGGADDYLTKPFSPRELVARVRNLLRRGPVPGALTRIGALELDVDDRSATLEGRALELGRLEFDLLVTLAGNPGRLFTRTELLERLWGAGFEGVDRVVDVHLSNLRRKLGVAARQLKTVRGEGYRFVEDA
jgi:two-component system alkaline phosphatase synthesis response regulator PhoP